MKIQQIVKKAYVSTKNDMVLRPDNVEFVYPVCFSMPFLLHYDDFSH